MTSEPLLPYLQVPELVLLPKHLLGSFPSFDISLKPFGILVATGVYLGSYLAVRQARRVGLSEAILTSFISWVLVVGFVSAHVLDVIFYYPGQVLHDPWSLVRLWEGLSSFGGFTGGLLGAICWKLRHRAKILPYADMIASAFPTAWVFGRMGCTTAHDHPGLHSDLWFAVRYPDGGRFDLGLYEMLLTIPLAVAFLLLRRQRRPWGFYCSLMSIAYAPVRFALDFLRERERVVEAGGQLSVVDPRYAGLTPAQWACLGLLAFGVFLFVRTLRGAGRPEAFAPPVASESGASALAALPEAAPSEIKPES
ncbi:MAG TPA: prolipoprotein diacylglyceryl transferase family protein [Polyangiaceae bacterium]